MHLHIYKDIHKSTSWFRQVTQLPSTAIKSYKRGKDAQRVKPSTGLGLKQRAQQSRWTRLASPSCYWSLCASQSVLLLMKVIVSMWVWTQMTDLYKFTSSAACGSVQEKLQELQEAINTLCAGGTAVTVPTVRNTWTSVPMTGIGGTSMRHPGTLSYVIPSVIPSIAKNVLVYATMYTGHANHVSQSIKVFTQDGSDKRYEKYLYSFSYSQNAINTNSGNMWFPMPTNRRIYMTVTHDAGANSAAHLNAVGYN